MNTAAQIELIAPADALRRQRDGAVIVDVRESHERATGFAEGALGIARGDLEADPDATLPDRNADVLLICQSGARSMKAAQALHAAGYTHVASVEGGTTRWIAEALPVTRDERHFDFYHPYSPPLRLPEVRAAGLRQLERGVSHTANVSAKSSSGWL